MHFQNVLLVAGALLSCHVIALPLSEPTIGNQPSNSNLESQNIGIQTRDDGLSISKVPIHSPRNAPDKLRSRALGPPTEAMVQTAMKAKYPQGNVDMIQDWQNVCLSLTYISYNIDL